MQPEYGQIDKIKVKNEVDIDNNKEGAMEQSDTAQTVDINEENIFDFIEDTLKYIEELPSIEDETKYSATVEQEIEIIQSPHKLTENEGISINNVVNHQAPEDKQKKKKLISEFNALISLADDIINKFELVQESGEVEDLGEIDDIESQISELIGSDDISGILNETLGDENDYTNLTNQIKQLSLHDKDKSLEKTLPSVIDTSDPRINEAFYTPRQAFQDDEPVPKSKSFTSKPSYFIITAEPFIYLFINFFFMIANQHTAEKLERLLAEERTIEIIYNFYADEQMKNVIEMYKETENYLELVNYVNDKLSNKLLITFRKIFSNLNETDLPNQIFQIFKNFPTEKNQEQSRKINKKFMENFKNEIFDFLFSEYSELLEEIESKKISEFSGRFSVFTKEADQLFDCFSNEIDSEDNFVMKNTNQGELITSATVDRLLVHLTSPNISG